MKYALLALDLDGTLVGPEGLVPAETVRALGAVARGGLHVVLATGRSRREAMPIWRQLRLPRPHEPLVLVGGALVSEPLGGRTLYQRTIPLDVALPYAETLAGAGYSAAILLDAWRHDVDYFLLESGDADRVWQRWFARTDVRVRRARRAAEIADMPDPLRINAVVDPARAEGLAEALRRRFGGALHVHSIFVPGYDVTVVEAFAAGVSKWTALTYVAQAYRLGRGKIVAVGDDINDLAMIQSAGLGAAMPTAPEEVLAAADRVIGTSLAAFLDDLLAGRLD